MNFSLHKTIQKVIVCITASLFSILLKQIASIEEGVLGRKLCQYLVLTRLNKILSESILMFKLQIRAKSICYVLIMQ